MMFYHLTSCSLPGSQHEVSSEGAGGGVQMCRCDGACWNAVIKEQLFMTGILIVRGRFANLDLHHIVCPSPDVDTMKCFLIWLNGNNIFSLIDRICSWSMR